MVPWNPLRLFFDHKNAIVGQSRAHLAVTHWANFVPNKCKLISLSLWASMVVLTTECLQTTLREGGLFLTNCIRRLEKQLPVHLTTTTHWQPSTLRTSVREILTCIMWEFLTTTLKCICNAPSQMFWGLSVYCGCKVIGCLIQLVFHTKVNLS